MQRRWKKRQLDLLAKALGLKIIKNKKAEKSVFLVQREEDPEDSPPQFVASKMTELFSYIVGRAQEKFRSSLTFPLRSDLRRAVDDILLHAADEPSIRENFSGEAINWADIGCVGVELVVTDYGEMFTRVIVAEADTRCYKLCAYVEGELARLGYEGVRVVTEW